jgi:hypothetical protein
VRNRQGINQDVYSASTEYSANFGPTTLFNARYVYTRTPFVGTIPSLGMDLTTLGFPAATNNVNKERVFKCVDAMRPLAQQRQVSVAQIALAWILSRPFVSSVIIGAKTMDQLRDNVAAARVELGADEIKQLDEVSQLSPEYPGWMLALQGSIAPSRRSRTSRICRMTPTGQVVNPGTGSVNQWA